MFAPALAAATLLALGTPSTWNLRISDMRDRLIVESPLIRAIGVNPYDFIFRLNYLQARLAAHPAQAPLSADLDAEAQLELKLDAELLVNLCPVFAAVSGLDESFYNDDPRAPPDPVAFYVPKEEAKKPYALVFVLHGRKQTETDVLSLPMLRDLADRTHAILVAPFGTGSELWGKDTAKEVLGIAAEMERGFAIDAHRVYVAGVDLGGAGAFRLAAFHPQAFRAILSLGGGADPNDLFSVVHGYRNGNVYLVGARETYVALASNCLPVSFYSSDSVPQAWTDMFDGTVRNSSNVECSGL